MKFTDYFANRQSIPALTDTEELIVMSSSEPVIYAVTLGELKSYLGLQNQEAVLNRNLIQTATQLLPSNSSEFVSISLGKTALITYVASDYPARIRLYSKDAYRQADLSRLVSAEPTGEHGLLLEAVTTVGNLSLDLSPAVWAFNGDAGSNIAATITNLDTVSRVITVSFSRLLLEV